MKVAADVLLRCGARHLFIRRRNEPFKAMLALPGGMVEESETVEAAAVRELAEETGILISEDQLRLVGVFSCPERDPRGRVISIGYDVDLPDQISPKAGSDAEAAAWLTAEQALRAGLAFDHADILKAVQARTSETSG
jgi:8-oxo-dGTP diphosphatase